MRKTLALFVVLVLSLSLSAVTADEAIVKLVVLASVEADGAKPYAIKLTYNTELDESGISASAYSVWNYWQDQEDSLELGSDPASLVGAQVEGSEVLLLLNTDYQAVRSRSFYLSLASSVEQVLPVKTASGEVIEPSVEAIKNYEISEKLGKHGIETEFHALDGTFQIDGISKYTIAVFPAKDCFEEATGEYVDVDLDYALFVPEDYSPEKNYMLVLHIEDAGALGNDARLVLTEARTPLNLASDEMQQFAKDQGYGGVIVLCPQITSALRSTRDNYSVSAAVMATWQLLDHITSEYSIDMDRIYGTGQSMGGMQVLAMAAQRDNYFAAIMSVGCQWGSNYNKEDLYEGKAYYPTPVDDVYVLSRDASGESCDYQNWYYMVSDDNMLSLNCSGDFFSTTVWQELAMLYRDFSGVEIPRSAFNPLTTPLGEQDRIAEELLSRENGRGIYWLSFEGGNHMATWVYSGKLSATYRWLLSQTASSENERGKLAELKNGFESTDQIRTPERLIVEEDGVSYYFVTGKPGAGTAGYNSGLYSIEGGAPVRVPGWSEAL